jgi:hypothetical protein
MVLLYLNAIGITIRAELPAYYLSCNRDNFSYNIPKLYHELK